MNGRNFPDGTRDLVFPTFEEANYHYRKRFVESIRKQLAAAEGFNDENGEVDLYNRLYDALAVDSDTNGRRTLLEECLLPVEEILGTAEGRGHFAQTLGDRYFAMGEAEAETLYRKAIREGTDDVLENGEVLARYPALLEEWLECHVEDTGKENDGRLRSFVATHKRALLELEFSRQGSPYREISPEEENTVSAAVSAWHGIARPGQLAGLMDRAPMLALCQWLAVHPDHSLGLHQRLLLEVDGAECPVPHLLYANRFADNPGSSLLLEWFRIGLDNPPDWDDWMKACGPSALLPLVFDGCCR